MPSADTSQVCNSLASCKQEFKKWKRLSDQSKQNLAFTFINLIISDVYLGSNYRIPDANLSKSLKILLEGDQIHLARTFLDQYRDMVPVYEVHRREMSNMTIFLAEWNIRLLMKENSPTAIAGSTDFVNQLTLFGIFNSPLRPISPLLGEITWGVFSLGVYIPYWAYRLPKGNRLAKIRAQYLRFLDENGYGNVARRLRESTVTAKVEYDTWIWQLGSNTTFAG